MSKFSFNQAGWEAYQTALEVLSATVGAAYQIDANKHWLPVTNGTQNAGSATARFGTGYFTQVDASGAVAGSGILSMTNTDTGATSDGRVYASNGTNKIGMIARSALNSSNSVAGVADMLYYTDATVMSWFWGSNVRMRANSNVLSMGTVDGITGTTGSSLLTGAWAPPTDTSGAALNDKVGGALVLAGGPGTGLGAGGNLYFSYYPAGTTGNVQGSRINVFHVDGTGILPELNSTYNLGSASFRMANIYGFNVDFSNNVTIGSGVMDIHSGSLYKTAAGRFGFFTTAPVVDLQVGGGSTYREMRFLRNVDGVTGQALVMYKSRGTESAPTAVLSGDSFGSIIAGGYDSTGTAGYRSSVSIGFTAAAAATGGILPGRLYFGVQPASPAAAGIINYMTIGEAEVRPVLTNVTSLGTSAVRWSVAYTTNLDVSGTLVAGTGTWAVGTTQLVKDASGNFGFGTSTPGSKIHLAASAASVQYLLTLENDSGAAGAATDVGIVFKTHNGTASVTQGYLFQTNSLWTTGAYGANALVLSGVGSGGVRIFAEGAAATVNTYAGGNTGANLVSTAQSTGLTINNTQNFTAGNMTAYMKTYSVGPATNVPIELTKGVSTLTQGIAYRVRLTTQGTSTITGSTYLISWNGTAWVASQVSANTGSTTNHPQLSVSGTTVNIFHSHASGSYVVLAYIESLSIGGTGPSGNGLWGADSFFSYEQNSGNMVSSVNWLNSGKTVLGATNITPVNTLHVETAGVAGMATAMSLGATGNGAAGRGVGMVFNAPGSTSEVASVRLDAYQEGATAAAQAAAFAISVADSAAGVMTERIRWNKTGETVLGNGEAVAAPVSATLRGTDGLGTDIAGANLTIRPGRGTGLGAGGVVNIQVAAAGGATGSALNALATVAQWNQYGILGIGVAPHTGWYKTANLIDFRGGRGAVGIASGGSVDATFLSANAVAATNDLGVTAWSFANTGQAAALELRSGFRFNYAASGTGGTAITWTNLGLWTTTGLSSNTNINPGATASYSLGTSALRWNALYGTTANLDSTAAGVTVSDTAGRLILAGGTTTADGASVVLRGSTNASVPGQLELWSWGTSGAQRWTVGGSTNTGHFFPVTSSTYDIGTSALHVRAIYADVYPDNPSKNYVKWATTVDVAPSTYTTGATSVLTGYANTTTVALTTTAGGMSVTTPANGTAGVKVGAAVSVATVNAPANSKIYSIGSSTVMTFTDITGWTLATTAITGTGTTATATFAAQTAPPYSFGSTIYISGATPSTYNGAFTVTAVTSTSVSWASAETVTATVQGSITNMVTTAITGTGTAATATFAARTYAPFAVGASITISGATPATYNGTFTVTACTTTSVSWASTETVTATVQGYVQSSITAGTAVNHTFTQTIAAFTPDGTAATVGDRVLVKDMTTIGGLTTDGRYTGVYTVTTVGSTTVAWVLTRASDSDTIAELAGATYVVLAGTANGGKSFRSYAKSTDTLDTTPIVWNKLIDQLASLRGPLPVTATGVDIATDTKTVWLTGGNVAAFAASSIGRMTVTATSASTYTTAASLYIAGTPIASTNVTMSTVYSLQVAQGMSYFAYGGNNGGSIQAAGLSASYGVVGAAPTLTGAVNVVMGTAASATWLISGTSNGSFRGGIQLLDAGGVMRLYSNTTTGVAVSGNDITPFATGNGNIGTSVLRFAGLYGNVADIAGNIKTTGATGVIGYGTGSGGPVTQLTSKATGVTNNKGSGLITTAADALAAGAAVAFTFTNSTIASTADSVIIHRQSGGTAGAYNVWVDSVAAGSCVIYLKNISGASLSEAVVLSFKVIAGANA